MVAASDGIVFCREARVFYRSGNPASYGSLRTRQAADSELRAWDAIVYTMTAIEKSDRVALAAATGYQRIQGRYYGRFPDLVAEAERQEQRHGGGCYRFGGGPLFRAVAATCGWKAAVRLRTIASSVRTAFSV